MAADSLLVGNRKASAKKLWKHKGNVIGIAGEYGACVAFVRWYMGEVEEEPDMENVNALVLTKEGRIFHYEQTLTPFEVDDDFGATGSGEQAAVAAMHMGADPVRAIEVACMVDPYTGGKVQTHRITKRKSNNG